MSPTLSSREARVQSWLVFALVLLSASYFFQSSAHNESARFDQIRSVSEHGEWFIDRFAGNSGDVVQVGGHTYPNKAPGTTLLGLIPWRTARAVLAVLPIDETKQLILTTYALTILMAGLPTALVSLMLLRLLANNGWTIPQATLISVGYGLGTIAFPFATLFFGHQLGAFLAFGAFYLIQTTQEMSPDGRRTSTLALSGLMLGFLPVVEYPGAIATGLIGLYAIATLGFRWSVPVILGSILGVLPLPLYNIIAFGHAESLGYGFYTKGSTFAAHSRGFMGVTWPSFDVLWQITFGSQRGLFYANPWLIAILVTPFLIFRTKNLRGPFVLSMGIVIAFLTFNAGFGDSIIYWGGAFSFGPRHLLIALPFAALLIALTIRERLLAPAVGLLIVATTLLMLPPTAVDPRLPYEPRDPYFSFYFPLYSRGLLSTYPWSTFEASPFVESSGAFNVGRWIGLPRRLEVLPLTILWAAAVFLLFRATDKRARGVIAALVIGVGLWPALSASSPLHGRTAGMCRLISPNRRWGYFSDYGLQPEPSQQLSRRLVPAPVITPGEQRDAFNSGALSSVAVTFSGDYIPPESGWYVFQLDTVGRAALYVDGMRRLRIDDEKKDGGSVKGQMYLSKAPHELMVRYMSDQKDRQLSVFVALKDMTPAPLNTGLTTGACGPHQ
ncbi:MAG: hypothetical protein ABI672_10845 [Vicinamibacteria bacterium]